MRCIRLCALALLGTLAAGAQIINSGGPSGPSSPASVACNGTPNCTNVTPGAIGADAAGAAATAQAASLQKASNLSDLASPSAARGNLGALPAATNPWAINLNNQVFYFEGSSITRAPHSGGNPVGTQLANGGLSGNYGSQFAASAWASGHGTYYNDGVDGSTSTSMLARYTAGNSNYGVTVPSAHAVCAAATAAGNRAFFFVDTTTVNNDNLNSISTATTVSNYQSVYASAHADGCIVVMLVAPGQNFGGGLTVNQDIRNGTIPSDYWIDMSAWLPDIADTAFWDAASHPTATGHKLLAANLVRALTADGDFLNGDLGSFAAPVTVISPGNSHRVSLNTDGSVSIDAGTMHSVPYMTWATAGGCSLQYAYCAESGQWTPSQAITITKIQVYLNTAPAGCTNAGTLLLQANSGGGTTLLSIPMVNGTQSYTVTGPVNVAAGTVLTVQNSSTAASGCSTYASSFGNTVEYRMQ